MKFSDCIKLAFLNLKSYKKTTAIIIIGMLTALCIIISACTYNSSMLSSMNDTIKNKYSQCYIDLDGVFLADNENALNKIKNIAGLSDIRIDKVYDYMLEFDPNFYAESYAEDYNTIDKSELVVDGKSFRGINDYSYDFFDYDGFINKSEKSVYFNIAVFYIRDSFSQFSKAEQREYCSKHNGDYLIGSEMRNDNDIIMSEYILSKYGFSSEDVQKLIGKKISLTLSYNGKTEEIVKDYTLCGVLKTEFYDVEEFRTFPHIIIPMNSKEDNFSSTQRLFFDDFSSAVNGFETLEKEDYRVSLSTNAAIYSEIEQQQILYNKIIILILSLIIFAVFVFMLSSVQYYFGKRLRFITLERAIGMKSGKIFSVFISEFVICGVTALIISIPLSYFLITGLSDFLNRLVGGTINISADDFITGALCGFIFVFAVSLIFAMIQFLRARKYNIVSVISE